MNPNSVLHEDLHIRPLQEGEVAVYKLCATEETDFSRMDEDTGKFRKKSPGWITSDRYTIFDKALKRKVIIGNVTGYRQEVMPDRTLKDVPVFGRVRFEMGKAVTLTSKDQATYEFLERLDQNRDNPFRDPSKPARFFRVNEVRVAEEKNHNNMILTSALTWIENADHIEIKAINDALPAGMKINMNDKFPIIRSQLFDLTKAHPILVMKASSNTKVKFKVQVMDASKFSIIEFDEKERTWHYNREERPAILSVEIGKNKIDALVDFFQTQEGNKFYKAMVSELKKFLNAGAPA